MEKVKLDIVSENFDQFFHKTCSNMSPEERAGIPIDIFRRLFNKNGKEMTLRTMERTGFLAKILILVKALKRRVFILVEGSESEGAMNIKDFVNYRAAAKEKDFGESKARELVTHGHFVVGDKELIDSMAYLNMLSAGPAYHFLTKLKNGKRGSFTEWQDQRGYVTKFILNYESNKKKWLKQFDISMSEFLVLMYGYKGNNFVGSEMYNGALVHAHYSSGADIRHALSSLRHRNYISKEGVSSNASFRITPLGKHLVDEILDMYAYRI